MPLGVVCFFFKQKTAYEMRISDWSSDVCSSDLEDLEELAFERDAVDRPLGARHRAHQLERRGARHLDKDAVGAGADRRPALAARDQPDLAEDRTFLDRHGDARRDLDLGMALRNPEHPRPRIALYQHPPPLPQK